MKTSGEDLATNLEQENLNSTQETRQAQGQANQRGTYVGQIPIGENTSKAPTSPYYEQYVGKPMAENQALRKQAIERAVQRQQEVAGITKTRADETATNNRSQALDEQSINYRKTQDQIDQEKKDAILQDEQRKYNEGITKYRYSNNIPS